MKLSIWFTFPVVLIFLISCSSPKIKCEHFGTLSDGREVKLYTLTNSRGGKMEICDYGARIVSIHMPDSEGVYDDVIVGCGSLEDFEKGPDRFIGCILGRYANRIDLSDTTLKLPLSANETLDGKPVHLHGGKEGFDRKLWDAECCTNNHDVGVKLKYRSKDGEEGYPGTLICSVTYWLTPDNTCRIEYEAETDAPTIVNLSNHSYFNMKGHLAGYVMDQTLQVEADSCIYNNLKYCPDSIRHVEGTPFDFRSAHRIDYRIDMPDKHLETMHGMSACWKLRNWDGTLRRACTLKDTLSGRGVEVWTTEPGLLTYTGRGFNGNVRGKYGPIPKFGGMVLETLHFANSPNNPRFPSTVLKPGEKYRSVTEFRFI